MREGTECGLRLSRHELFIYDLNQIQMKMNHVFMWFTRLHFTMNQLQLCAELHTSMHSHAILAVFYAYCALCMKYLNDICQNGHYSCILSVFHFQHNKLPFSLKGGLKRYAVHTKMKSCHYFTHPQVVPNLYGSLSSAEHKIS